MNFCLYLRTFFTTSLARFCTLRSSFKFKLSALLSWRCYDSKKTSWRRLLNFYSKYSFWLFISESMLIVPSNMAWLAILAHPPKILCKLIRLTLVSTIDLDDSVISSESYKLFVLLIRADKFCGASFTDYSSIFGLEFY